MLEVIGSLFVLAVLCLHAGAAFRRGYEELYYGDPGWPALWEAGLAWAALGAGFVVWIRLS